MVARYPNIDPGDLREFKQVAAKMLELTRGEAGTDQYDFS
jgi:quinol monooxygenase YgiN